MVGIVVLRPGSMCCDWTGMYGQYVNAARLYGKSMSELALNLGFQAQEQLGKSAAMHQQEDFLRLFVRHEAELRAFIGAVVRDAHAREDVFQETVVILWREFPRYDPGRPFGAWARGIAAKKLLEQRNNQRRSPLLCSPEAIRALADAAERATSDKRATLEALEHCVARLPDRSRRLLAMRYGQSQPPETIARHLGMTIAAVYQALWRLRGALRQCMRRYLARQDAG